MIFRVPIDFYIESDNENEMKQRINEFLLRAVTELREYGVKDYEQPFGYAVEEILPNP